MTLSDLALPRHRTCLFIPQGWFVYSATSANSFLFRETTSIPVNPRTNRPVGYAFVDLKTSDDAEKAITELSGKEILERKVSVQLARKPEPASERIEGATSGGEGGSGGEGRKRGSGRGRGRGRGRGGRLGRGGRAVSALPFTFNPFMSS